MLYVDLI